MFFVRVFTDEILSKKLQTGRGSMDNNNKNLKSLSTIYIKQVLKKTTSITFPHTNEVKKS